MKVIKGIFVFVLIHTILFSCMKGKKVDQLFHNASIICLDDNNTTGEAMAIKNGKIVEIGPERQILNKYRSEETIDVEGREIVPAFSDCNMHLDSTIKLNTTILEEFETQELEQGIIEVFVHGISYKQLIELVKFSSKMEILWHIYLTPSKENIQYVRSLKKIKNKNFTIAGFTLSNEQESTVLEACSIAKNKLLQIGLDFINGQKNIPTIIYSLQSHIQDHRWFVFNIDENQTNALKLLEENNFFLCFNETNRATLPIYTFGSGSSKNGLLDKLKKYSRLNGLELLTTLKSITNWAQYVSYSERKNGTLEKGKKANFTILETPINNNGPIYANTTFLNGKKIYSIE